jgi:cation-transporting P-type ATPase E
VEKTVSKKITKSNNDALKALIESDQDTQDEISKPKKQKGPKTIIKEDLITMKGDPLGLHVPLDDEPKEVLNLKNRVKTKDDIVVERYNPEVEKGLTTEEVELRQMAGLANITDSGSLQKVFQVSLFPIFLPSLTFLNFGIAGWLFRSDQAFQFIFLHGCHYSKYHDWDYSRN